MEDQLSRMIIKASIEVHRSLGGPGLLESIYEAALCHELSLQGLYVQKQIAIEVTYKGVQIRDPLYLDILVNNKVIIEVKAVEQNQEIHKAQLLTYLRLTGLKLGLLINFGQSLVTEGINRVVNRL